MKHGKAFLMLGVGIWGWILGGGVQAAPIELSNGLAAYWTFDEPGGTVAHNCATVSQTLQGALQGDAAFTAGGMFGNAISMTSTGYVNVASEVVPDGVSEYTYSVWFKNLSSDSNQHYFLETTPENSWIISARLTPSSRYVQTFSYTSGSVNGPTFYVPPERINDWNLLVVTYKQGVGLTAYLNGALAGSVSFSGILAATDGLRIGADRNLGRKWNGLLDDMGIWTRALNTDEIAYLWNSGAGNRIQPVNVLQGLVANWSMNESSGVIAHNSVSSSVDLDGRLQGNAQFAPGKMGNAVLLDGNGDYVDVLNEVVPDGAPAYSVAAWVKSTNLTYAGRQFIFESSGSFSISAELDGSTLPYKFKYSLETTGNQVSKTTNVNPTQDAWHFVVVTYDQAAGLGQIYVDGVELASYRITGLTGALRATDGFHIGTYRNADGRWFTGLIDEVSVWNRVLTAAEVAYLWNNGMGLQIIPEPSTWLLFGVGAVLLPWLGRRMRKRAQ